METTNRKLTRIINRCNIIVEKASKYFREIFELFIEFEIPKNSDFRNKRSYVKVDDRTIEYIA